MACNYFWWFDNWRVKSDESGRINGCKVVQFVEASGCGFGIIHKTRLCEIWVDKRLVW